MDSIENKVEAESPMDRIDNDEPPTHTPMEIESTQYGVDNVICHKCGAWIVAKNAHGARLTLWGHPAECRYEMQSLLC